MSLRCYVQDINYSPVNSFPVIRSAGEGAFLEVHPIIWVDSVAGVDVDYIEVLSLDTDTGTDTINKIKAAVTARALQLNKPVVNVVTITNSSRVQ